MNERTRVLSTAGASWVDFKEKKGYYVREDEAGFVEREEGVRQQTLRGMVGMDHRFTETLQVRILAGVQYTESEFPSVQGVGFVLVPPANITAVPIYEMDKAYDTSVILDGSLNWRREGFRLSGNVNRDFTPSIYGENITRDRVRASLKTRLSERFEWTLTTAYYRSETEGYVEGQEYHTVSLRPSLIYRFTEALKLGLGYHYTWTENQITNRSEDRNRVFVELGMAWSM
jgi:hypothetical protein